jgi:hypothetical protein
MPEDLGNSIPTDSLGDLERLLDQSLLDQLKAGNTQASFLDVVRKRVAELKDQQAKQPQKPNLDSITRNLPFPAPVPPRASSEPAEGTAWGPLKNRLSSDSE